MPITRRKMNLTTTVDRETGERFKQLAELLGHGGSAQLLRVMVEEILVSHQHRKPAPAPKEDTFRGFL